MSTALVIAAVLLVAWLLRRSIKAVVTVAAVGALLVYTGAGSALVTAATSVVA